MESVALSRVGRHDSIVVFFLRFKVSTILVETANFVTRLPLDGTIPYRATTRNQRECVVRFNINPLTEFPLGLGYILHIIP